MNFNTYLLGGGGYYAELHRLRGGGSKIVNNCNIFFEWLLISIEFQEIVIVEDT